VSALGALGLDASSVSEVVEALAVTIRRSKLTRRESGERAGSPMASRPRPARYVASEPGYKVSEISSVPLFRPIGRPRRPQGGALWDRAWPSLQAPRRGRGLESPERFADLMPFSAILQTFPGGLGLKLGLREPSRSKANDSRYLATRETASTDDRRHRPRAEPGSVRASHRGCRPSEQRPSPYLPSSRRRGGP
jgi:hypothetical protein